MKLAISTLACPDWSLEQIIETVAANHIQGIDFRGLGPEIDITRLPAFNEDLPATLAALAERNIELPCYNTSVTLVTPAPERWQMMLEECHRYAQLAQKTRSPSLRIFGGAAPKGMTHDEALLLARRHLKQLSKLTRPFGCRVLLETHDAWTTGPAILQLLEGLNPADVGVLWDAEHPWRHGEPMAETAAALKHYLGHTHIKDTRHTGEQKEQMLLGEGQLPLKEFLAALRGIGYAGWVSLETEKRWVASAPDPDISIPQFARWMKENEQG
jgi:fatty-acyl-CoA synthase